MSIYQCWTYQGYTCFIRDNGMGFLCGYVALPKDDHLFGFDDEELYSSGVEPHGGITFSQIIVEKEQIPFSFDEPLSLPCHIIGFDCAHYGDAPDEDLIWAKVAQGLDDESVSVKELDEICARVASSMYSWKRTGGHVWTEEEIIAETERMADAVFCAQ